MKRLALSIFALASLTALPRGAWAHAGSSPPVAWPIKPEIVGEVVDRSYTVTWRDTDRASLTSTVTFDVHFTSEMPATWPLGIVPMGLTGDYIAAAIPEADRTNSVSWDTSRVPAGSYFVWIVGTEDPPDTNPPLTIVAFSRGVVTVAHPGDAVHPSVIVPLPDGPFTTADERFEIEYESFDPDGSARVRLEAQLRGAPIMTIAQDLPASPAGKFTWNTKDLPGGDYALKATITDRRGLSFTAWSRFFLLIDHPTPPDAGVAADDAGTVGPAPDAGVVGPAADAGMRVGDAEVATTSSSCGCTTSAGAPRGSWVVLAFGLALALARCPVSGRRVRNPDGRRTIS